MATQYEYKVVSIQTTITQSDISKNQAGAKVAAQVEIKLQELSKAGWEFYGQYPVDVDVKSGCTGTKTTSATVLVLVFKRPVV